MIHEIRGNGERADLQNFPICEVEGNLRHEGVGHEGRSRAHNAGGRGAHGEGDLWPAQRQQTPMIAVPVRDDDRVQRRIRNSEAADVRE